MHPPKQGYGKWSWAQLVIAVRPKCGYGERPSDEYFCLRKCTLEVGHLAGQGFLVLS